MDHLSSDPFDLLVQSAQAAPRPADSSHAASSCAAGSSGLACCHAVCSSCICSESCGFCFQFDIVSQERKRPSQKKSEPRFVSAHFCTWFGHRERWSKVVQGGPGPRCWRRAAFSLRSERYKQLLNELKEAEETAADPASTPQTAKYAKFQVKHGQTVNQIQEIQKSLQSKETDC